MSTSCDPCNDEDRVAFVGGCPVWRIGSAGTTILIKIIIISKEKFTMAKTILEIQNRIHLLDERDPVGNLRIINKLKRQLRKLETEQK